MRDKIMAASSMKEAMKNKDKTKLNVLRNLKSEISRRENGMGGVKVLTDSDIISLVKKDIQSLKETKSDGWELEIEELGKLLPKQLSKEEIMGELDKLRSANDNLNIGDIMKYFSKNFPDSVDKRELSKLIKG